MFPTMWQDVCFQKKVISPVDELFDWKTLEVMGFVENEATKNSIRLHEVAV